VLDYPDRVVVFDSNVLTYFLNGNRGEYSWTSDQSLTDQAIAAVRLYLYCRTFVTPTVKAEALRIRDEAKHEEHLRFICTNFGELNPDRDQKEAIERRARELQPRHIERDLDDCRIVAEVEQDDDIPVLATYDFKIRSLASHTRIRIETPVECWAAFGIPRGTAPKWTPAPDHPLHDETWWR
jgi:hypothetical protein